VASATGEVSRLSRRGRTVRLVSTVAVLGVLAYGQVVDTNDWFPFGSLSQYATARDMNGTVNSIFLLADTDQEQGKFISANMNVIGVGRAEIEGQLNRLLAHPELMQAFIDSYARLNPDKPPIRTIYLKRSTQQLVDGYVVGEKQYTELLRWHSTTPSEK
jgi:hypothetical protein